MLLAIAIVADDDGVIGFGSVIEATGKRKQFESSELSSIIGNHEAARAGNGTERVHDARMGNSNDITWLQHDVAGRIAGFQNAR
jgi:hypothetical protein